MTSVETYLKKNDLVMVVAGKEKGKSGKILRINPKTSRVLVEKLNLVKKFQKPSQKNPQGGIVEKEAGIHLSNLMLFCSKCSKPVRISKTIKGEKKIRICKKCKEVIA